MLQRKRRLLPAVEAYGVGFWAPGRVATVSLGKVAERSAWVLSCPTRQYSIVVASLAIVRVVECRRIVHAWVEEVVKVFRLLVAHEIR